MGVGAASVVAASVMAASVVAASVQAAGEEEGCRTMVVPKRRPKGLQGLHVCVMGSKLMAVHMGANGGMCDTSFWPAKTLLLRGEWPLLLRAVLNLWERS